MLGIFIPWTWARERIWKQFTNLQESPAPEVPVPSDPKEAMAMGYQMGLQKGYGKGLTDGVDLGMDVGSGNLPVSLSSESPS